MNIIFLGTKGIPNRHGGFERFVEKLAPILVNFGHAVTVACPNYQEYRKSIYKGVKLRFFPDLEKRIGAIGNLMYDFATILYASLRRFNIIYMCAYTSGFLLWIPRVLSPRSILVTNMDGLEWKRAKWSNIIQKYLRFCEALAMRFTKYAIADGLGINLYLRRKYSRYTKKIVQIEYGTEFPIRKTDDSILAEHYLQKNGYFLLVARIEPENKIEMVIKGLLNSKSRKPLVVVGPLNTPHASYLLKKYGKIKTVVFTDGLYDELKVYALRKYAIVNFHGHSVGGTNPSLLEALAIGKVVAVHKNIFNQGVVGNVGFIGFKSAREVAELIDRNARANIDYSKKYQERIKKLFTWEIISKKYQDWFLEICKG